MKPKNFPGRKLLRQLRASRPPEHKYDDLTDDETKKLSRALAVRTKKYRGTR